MYTRCPECDTLFRVTAEQLRLAHGHVRCGSCAHSFDALESLSDGPPDSGGPLRDTPSAADAAPDAELEFDAPESTWGQFFIEAPRASEAASRNPGEADEPAAPSVRSADDLPEPPPAPVMLDDVTGGAAEWQALLQGLDDEQGPPPVAEIGPDDVPAEEPGGPVFILGDEPARQPAAAAHSNTLGGAPDNRSSYPVPQSPGNDESWMDHGTSEGPEPPPWEQPASTGPHTAPLPRGARLAAIGLVALLALQLVHYSRDVLAADPRVGGLVRSIYGTFGWSLYPHWRLDAFSVRGAEALAGGSAPDALDISAVVEVAEGTPVGLPMVRVVLRDQWLNTVASGVFSPDQYLAADSPGIVAGGASIPVRLSVRDPGIEARGYVLDVCLPRRTAGLECQLSREPFRP